MSSNDTGSCFGCGYNSQNDKYNEFEMDIGSSMTKPKGKITPNSCSKM